MASGDSYVRIDPDGTHPQHLPDFRAVGWMEGPSHAHRGVPHWVGYGTDGGGSWSFCGLSSNFLFSQARQSSGEVGDPLPDGGSGSANGLIVMEGHRSTMLAKR